MTEITNVEYEVQKELTAKTTEELQIEVNGLYQQMEMIGSIAMMIAANAGQRLLVIKERLNHGEFESWCESHLDFSKRKAEMMMSLAKRCEEENSLFSKAQTFADLNISKVFALLAAPEEVAKEVVENNDISEMTVRELKEEIADLKLQNAEIVELKSRIKELEEEKGEPGAISKEIEELKEKLKKEKDKLKKTKRDKDDEVKKALEKARVELDREIEKAVATANIQTKTEKIKTEKELEEARAEIEKLNMAASSGETITAFRINVKSMQTIFNECLGQLAKMDENTSSKFKKALTEILTSELEALNE
ncbi:DUF3102 domain-containing protein [Mogibacterium timidum]|uniref:DUF3102 domain-containing protein n=1 Tax=Mogibacterium timidum TaxID=35519 RepID=UPI0028DC263B|nr:DUF3102 domain-containing protein [Mogibacterium timidum]